MTTSSLVLAIQTNQSLNVFEFLVNVFGEDVKSRSHFSFNNLEFEDVPAVFAAIVAGQKCATDFLIKMHPHFVFENIVSVDAQKDLLEIDILELVGGACILCGDESTQRYGFKCWNMAMQLRYAEDGTSVYPKTILPQSQLEKFALRNKQESKNTTDLKLLLEQKREEFWKIEAFLVTKRILSNYGVFPNCYTLLNFHQASFKNWDFQKLNKSYVFLYCLYIMELCGPCSLKRQIKPSEIPFPVINSMLEDFLKVLKDCNWFQNQLWKDDPVITFERLFFSIDFTCAYLMSLHDLPASLKEQQKVKKTILQIARSLVSLKMSYNEKEKLSERLRGYFVLFEHEWNSKLPNFLMKVCSSSKTNDLDLNLIQLLLDSGANPNVVDANGSSPLHLLALTESSFDPWNSSLYPIRALHFTNTVRTFLEKNPHYDLVNRDGQKALDCLKKYPYDDFRLLFHFFNNRPPVKPLACLAATVIRTHNLSISKLDFKLQNFVLFHAPKCARQ